MRQTVNTTWPNAIKGTCAKSAAKPFRYVIGRVEIAALHREPERHLHCNPVLSQFIVDDKFPPVSVEGDFSKCHMDDESRRREEELVTRGWQRLKEVGRLGLSVPEYPLPGL